MKSIDADAFKGLILLRFIDMSNNELKCIPPTLLQKKPMINYLMFNNNQISEIHADTFKNLPNVYNIDFMNNSIVNLPAFDFTGTISSSTSIIIQFDYNPFNSISPKLLFNVFNNRNGTTGFISVMLFTLMSGLITCILNSPDAVQISNSTLATANVTLWPCYDNWKDSYQTHLSCAPNYPVESTTKKVDIENGNSNFPLSVKNFFSIITNIVKNFTATVTFY
ncbi:hypothetical protein PVAND_000086 [Polypedilum vanderplanki]|uniref:Uncharacterized protein n=1 Tax=Polypedilum vanderplanki TaxID=319348 RepID=A0A9J6BIR9_POLVA|nr:hypothetical protein PVAND_000086 [Polypedilum vanderplanki]